MANSKVRSVHLYSAFTFILFDIMHVCFWSGKVKTMLYQQKKKKSHKLLCLAGSLAERMKGVLTCLKGQTDSKHPNN